MSSAGALTYNVFAGTSAGHETLVLSRVTGTGATITGLTSGTTYYFYLTATNSGGDSSRSPEVYSIVVASAPIGVTATTSGNTTTLSWVPTPGAQFYEIWELPTGGLAPQLVDTGIVQTSFGISQLESGTTHTYYVIAINAGGSSAASQLAVATIRPDPPATLLANSIEKAITLTWSTSNGASSYDVYVGAQSGSENSNPEVTGVTGNTVTVLGLNPANTYYFVVRAVNAGGSSDVSVESAGIPIPSPPLGVSASASNANISIHWSESPGATTYDVYQGVAPASESSTPIATGIVATSYTMSGLANGQIYFLTVAATNAGGTSAQSLEVSATPQAPASSSGQGGGGGGGGGAVDGLALGALVSAVTLHIQRRRKVTQ
jgi:fibronectin type 3 domain-containing protein